MQKSKSTGKPGTGFSAKALDYFARLRIPELPSGIELMNPYSDKLKFGLVKQFFQKYYGDPNPRLFIFGINPGRFGGGLTGISFTDPVALRTRCGIENDLGNKKELSSQFIYQLISRYGTPEKFFAGYFLTALFPAALLKDGKNYNFYDDRETFELLLPFLKRSVKAQTEFGARRDKVVSLGKRNAVILKKINDELMLFDKIEILDHPRFIMQYRRKQVNDYIDKYLEALR